MSALLLAWLHKYPANLRHAVESALAGLQAVLHKTHEAAGSLPASPTQKDAAVRVTDRVCGALGRV